MVLSEEQIEKKRIRRLQTLENRRVRNAKYYALHNVSMRENVAIYYKEHKEIINAQQKIRYAKSKMNKLLIIDIPQDEIKIDEIKIDEINKLT